MQPHEPDAPPAGVFHPRPSPAAIAIVLMLVGTAVLFGVLGPSIAGRLSMGGGVPLSEVVTFAGSLRGDAMMKCQQLQDDSDLHVEEARGIVRQALRRNAAVPDLQGSGFALRQVARVSLPGSAPERAACATWQGTGESDGHWVHLFLAPDDGQYLSFDSVGRPRPLAPDLPIEGELPGRLPGQTAVVLVWSDGPVLHVACFEDAADADRLREAIGVP